MLFFIEKFNYWKSMKKMKRSIEDNPTKVNIVQTISAVFYNGKT